MYPFPFSFFLGGNILIQQWQHYKITRTISLSKEIPSLFSLAVFIVQTEFLTRNLIAIMTSCYRRFNDGLTASPSSSLVQSQKPTRTAEIHLQLCNQKHLRPGLVLQSSNCSRFYIVAAAERDELRKRSSGREGGGRASSSSCAAEKRQGGGDGKTLEIGRRHVDRRTVEVVIAAAITVVLGVGNRVLYKLALVPLKQYPFFLAQLATFG